MKRKYKLKIAVLLLLIITTSSASAITEIGDNITVPNNVTAQNFIGSLNWAYLLGIPADFPNATVAGNLANWNATYNTTYDSKISAIQSNETGYAKLDGSRNVAASWNWGGFNLTNVFKVAASFFEGDGSRLSNLNAGNLTGTFNASTDARNNFPNSTVASKEAGWDGKTTLAQVNASAQVSRSQVTGQTVVDDSQNTTKANKTGTPKAVYISFVKMGTTEQITGTNAVWQVPTTATAGFLAVGQIAVWVDMAKLGTPSSAELVVVYTNSAITGVNNIALTKNSAPIAISTTVTPIESSNATMANVATYPQTIVQSITPSELGTTGAWFQYAIKLAAKASGPNIYSLDLILYYDSQ